MLRSDPSLKKSDKLKNESESTKRLFVSTLKQGNFFELRRKASNMKEFFNRKESDL